MNAIPFPILRKLGALAGLSFLVLQPAGAVQEFEYGRSGALIEAVTSGASTAPTITRDPASGNIEVGGVLSLSVTVA